jgi:hypothetical protein
MRSAFSKPLPALAIAAMLSISAAYGEKNNPAPHKAPAAPPPASRSPRGAPGGPKGAATPKGGPVRPPANPYNAVDRWNAMNPKQRERLLSKLPPDKKQQFLDKMDKFNALPKEEQRLARERYERLSHLPPEEQQVVRRDMYRFDKLPPARRQAITEELLKLRKMSETERSAYLASSDFQDKFYPAEQQMIGNFTKVLAMRK